MFYTVTAYGKIYIVVLLLTEAGPAVFKGWYFSDCKEYSEQEEVVFYAGQYAL